MLCGGLHSTAPHRGGEGGTGTGTGTSAVTVCSLQFAVCKSADSPCLSAGSTTCGMEHWASSGWEPTEYLNDVRVSREQPDIGKEGSHVRVEALCEDGMVISRWSGLRATAVSDVCLAAGREVDVAMALHQSLQTLSSPSR